MTKDLWLPPDGAGTKLHAGSSSIIHLSIASAIVQLSVGNAIRTGFQRTEAPSISKPLLYVHYIDTHCACNRWRPSASNLRATQAAKGDQDRATFTFTRLHQLYLVKQRAGVRALLVGPWYCSCCTSRPCTRAATAVPAERHLDMTNPWCIGSAGKHAHGMWLR